MAASPFLSRKPELASERGQGPVACLDDFDLVSEPDCDEQREDENRSQRVQWRACVMAVASIDR